MCKKILLGCAETKNVLKKYFRNAVVYKCKKCTLSIRSK